MKQRLRIFVLLTSHYMKHMQRKWKSLPLLLFFPLLIIGFLIMGISSFFMQSDEDPIQVGLVDHDQSEETELIIRAFIEETDLNNFIEITSLQESEASKRIEQDELSAYVLFPEGFTTDLYKGKSIEIPVHGNAKRTLESQLTYQFVRSITRLIETAQANILTIYSFAQDLPMEEDERTNILFDEFKEFFFYTINKDDILQDEVLQNKATFSPVKYFSMAALFFTSIVWSLLLYVTLYKETTANLLSRMKLYGVHASQLVHGRIFVAYICSLVMTTGLFFSMKPFLFQQVDVVSNGKIIGLFALCIGIFLLGLAIIDQLFSSMQFRFSFQLIYTTICIIGSGAILPRMYFPMYMQSSLDWFFPAYTFDTLLHITIFDGVFVSYGPLWILSAIAIVLYISISYWKERFVS